MVQRLALSLLALGAFMQGAQAMVFSCLPLRAKGEQVIEAYLDGFAHGEYPPRKIDAIRVLARFGADAYEFFPEHTKSFSLANGVLRFHLFQPLSAGSVAEMRFEGKLATKKGEEFPMRFSMRSEQREGQGDVRCSIE